MLEMVSVSSMPAKVVDAMMKGEYVRWRSMVDVGKDRRGEMSCDSAVCAARLVRAEILP